MTSPAVPDVETLTVDSPVLGPLTLDAAELFTFRHGLVGLPDCHRYALVDSGRPGFWWLQSADAPGLVFLLADPFRLVEGYDVEVPDGDVAHLGAAGPDDLTVLAVVTLPRAGEAASANLRAPVVLNARTRAGRQVVLTDDRWRVTHPVAI